MSKCGLMQAPTRDPETLDCVAICECGHEVRSNDKDECWQLLVNHQLPWIEAEIAKLYGTDSV